MFLIVNIISTNEKTVKVPSKLITMTQYNFLSLAKSQSVLEIGYGCNSKLIVAITIAIDWFTM